MLSTLYFADGPRPPAASLCLPTKTHAETHQVPASSQGDHDDVDQDDYVDHDDVDQDDYVNHDDVDQDEDVDGDNSRCDKYLWLWRNSKMW